MIIEAQVLPDDGGGPKGAEVVVKTLKKDPLGPQPIAPIVAKPNKGIKLQERSLPQVDLADMRKKIEESALANLPISAAAGAGSPSAGTLLAGRDPRVRSRLLNIEGGSDRSEIAVAMGALDGPTGTHLHLHIFTADKGDYYEIADGLPQE